MATDRTYSVLDWDEGDPRGLPDAPRRGRESDRRARRRSGREWIFVVIGAFCTWLFLQTFVVQAFTIPSESMAPTLDKGDHVLVNKLATRFGDVHRGDVVVFHGSRSTQCGSYRFLVKRVVGLPGERVEARNGVLLVDGAPLAEPYVAPGAVTDDFPQVVVPAGSYWMMGDNREVSCDSRRFGAIAGKAFVAPVFVRFWPPGRVGGI